MDTQVVQESLIKAAAHLLSRHFLFMKSDKIKAARFRAAFACGIYRNMYFSIKRTEST